MRVSQIDQLKREGFALSNNFKTVGTYGLQPIILSKTSYQIVCIYVEYIRPIIIPVYLWKPDDFLWITYKGQPEKNIGKYIKTFFQKKLKLNVTSNVFRSLYETETENLYREGILSGKSRNIVNQINGHRGTTVQKYYLKTNIKSDIQNARNIFKTISRADNCNQYQYSNNNNINVNNRESSQYVNNDNEYNNRYIGNNYNQYENVQSDDLILNHNDENTISDCSFDMHNISNPIISKAPWGTLHSHYQSSKSRIPWDQAEVNFIGELAMLLLNENDEKNNKNLMSNCLKVIKHSRPDAIPIFHENHILDTTRFL